MNLRRLALVILLAALGCGGGEPSVPTVSLETGVFEVTAPARGVLRAVNSTPIQVPPTLGGGQTIAWLAEDGILVKAGEPLVRLDETQVSRDLQLAGNEISRLGLEMESKGRDHYLQQRDLQGQIDLLNLERDIALHFAPKDAEIFSRHEIIDSQVNLEFLETKQQIFQGKQKRQQHKQTADMDLLRLKRQTQEVRQQQLTTSLNSLVLTAPHDGVFLVGRNWNDEPLRMGMNVWRGMRVGELPDLATMEARVKVLESEAGGVAVGQTARVELDSLPGRIFPAKVKTVEAVAQPLEEGSPVKFFEVVLSLEKTDPEVMRPGREVAVRIVVQREEKVLTVPNQALFHKGDENWVFVWSRGRFNQRPVTLGSRSLTHTVVKEGLKAGERVAMAEPEKS